MLVDKIAKHVYGSLPQHVVVDLDDLRQSGIIGLLDASTRYSGDKQASFETYAGYRIKGEMIEELRRYTWLPRSMLRRARDMDDSQEVVLATPVSLEQTLDTLGDVVPSKVFDESYDRIEARQMLSNLLEELRKLEEIEKRILREYYLEDKQLKDVAKDLKLTPSRISQIYHRALRKLKDALSHWAN
jgi:RNA polymerase sigma factor for flagellar operon FliA